MYSIRTKETRGLLAVIMAFVMMFAGVAFIAAEVDAEGDASESTGYVMFNETSYPSLNAAMTAAEDVVKTNPDATYTFEVYGNVEWITGAEHGSTPFVKEGTDSVNTIFNIIGDGKTSTITAIGDGVGPLGLVNGTVNYNNLTIIDESVSYAENNWEFTYLEFRGVSVFNNCYFKCAISVDHDNGNNQGKTISFNKCIFESQKDSEYGVWVGDGTVSFTECNFTSYRGLKIHECYGSQLHSVTVDNCKFVNLTEKPGIAIGDVYQSGEEGSYGEDKPVEWEDTSNTLIVVKNCTFIGCEAGDQSRYVYETDTELGSWFTFIDNEIIVMSGSTLGNITLTEGAIVTLEEGALFEGTVTSGTDKLTGKFKAGSGGVTFSVGSIVMDGNPIDIPSGASSITVSGEVELSGEIGVDIIVEASEEPGKETVVTIPENSNTTLKSGVTITLKSNTSMDILGTLDGDADSIVMDDGADNVDVNAKDPESVESIVSSEIDVGEPGVTTVKTAEEFIAALGDSRTETVRLHCD